MDKLNGLLGHEKWTEQIYLSPGLTQRTVTSDLHKPKDTESPGGWQEVVTSQ